MTVLQLDLSGNQRSLKSDTIKCIRANYYKAVFLKGSATGRLEISVLALRVNSVPRAEISKASTSGASKTNQFY